MTIGEFAEAVAEIAQRHGGSSTRRGSTDAHSIAVGGFAGDPHTWWLGEDLTYDVPPDPAAVERDAAARGLKVLHEEKTVRLPDGRLAVVKHDHFQPADFPAGPVTTYGGHTRALA